MKKIVVIVLILFVNPAIAEDINIPSAVYKKMGYRIVSSKVFDPTSWEKRKFNILEKELAIYVKNDTHDDIYSFDIDVSFMSYDVNKNIINKTPQ